MGFTQALSVRSSFPGLRDAEEGTMTIEFTSLNSYAVPECPGTPRVTLEMFPLFPFPDESTMVDDPAGSFMW